MTGMSVAARFDAALAAQDDDALAGPELFPLRLVRACVELLGADGAGISLLLDDSRRLPLAASDPVAGIAERLQFTLGAGPCLLAHESRRPVVATEDYLTRRWPEYTAALHTQTDYRAVAALPIERHLAGLGALDLYFHSAQRLLALDVFEALSAAQLAVEALDRASMGEEWTAEHGPSWAHSPAAQSRARVWQAIALVDCQHAVGTSRALDLLREHARRRGQLVEASADALLRGEIGADDVGDLSGAR